jgi:hypothetical protein
MGSAHCRLVLGGSLPAESRGTHSVGVILTAVALMGAPASRPRETTSLERRPSSASLGALSGICAG